jgi:hypothetical protein
VRSAAIAKLGYWFFAFRNPFIGRLTVGKDLDIDLWIIIQRLEHARVSQVQVVLSNDGGLEGILEPKDAALLRDGHDVRETYVKPGDFAQVGDPGRDNRCAFVAGGFGYKCLEIITGEMAVQRDLKHVILN